MKIFVPPIKCQGIKTKLVEWIVQKVNLENQGRWIEPFMGSGVVGFNIRPQRAIFSDINPHIINFYNAIKSGEITAQTARTFLEHEGAILRERGESYYYEVRERFNNNKNSFDMLFLNRASFNGVMRFNKKGFYNAPPDLNDLDEGDLKYKIDFRNVYATLLEKWLRVSDGNVISPEFKPLDFI